jgi:hypothetical protein
MTILVQRDGRLYFSAGNLSRLAISGQDIPEPLDINIASITSLDKDASDPDALVINGVKYPHCVPAYNDIRLMIKYCDIDKEAKRLINGERA